MDGGDMSEPNRDPAIKLFGAKIQVPDTQILAQPQNADINKVLTKEDVEDAYTDTAEELDKSSSLNNVIEDDQTPVQANEVQANAKINIEQSESNTDQEKGFKRPDKILPCPRCSSMDTKFCYFNNYNVNQPRHFCKNCQRYWTAGGTMRNVPVGAGRRKNKHFASQYRQIIVSPNGVPVSGLEIPGSINHQLIPGGDSATSFRPSTGNGTVLKFGPEAPLCESMETVINLGDRKRSVEMGSVHGAENGEEPSSSGSSLTASSIRGNELPENVMQKERVTKAGSCNEHNTQQPVHCYPIPPLCVPWNPGWNNVVSMPPVQHSSDRVCLPNSSNPGPVQWCPTPVLAVPGFCSSNVPLQFVPASYWGCMTVLAAGAGNMSLTGSNGCLSSASSACNNSCCSGNGSPTLGKHSRDTNLIDKQQSEKCILVPKTQRIDVPDEASKSPIWATLGIEPEQKDTKPGVTIFKGFKTKKEGRAHVLEGTQILEANPAALSRSHTFQEGT